ncbi:protein FAM71F2-like [Callorhinchus milii]|uniref:protein FAM71F2-like n=1 Tax=Callorhinchus milii TaxID=7868 RepID=UPI001C3F5EEB|nr:protein FAM71F2-like [Callorhinchus milii]
MDEPKGFTPDVPSQDPNPTQLGVEGGSLHKLLRSKEYDLFSHSAVFESDFIQVTRRGNLVDIHNVPTPLTLGITASVPFLPLPNILIVATKDPESEETADEAPSMKITRMLPMKLVRLSVHKKSSRCLKLGLANRSTFYLQLQDKHPNHVFRLWEELINIIYSGLSITFKDTDINLPKTSMCDSVSSSSSGVSSEKGTHEGPELRSSYLSSEQARAKQQPNGSSKEDEESLDKGSRALGQVLGKSGVSTEVPPGTSRALHPSLVKGSVHIFKKEWVPDSTDLQKARTRPERLLNVKEENSPVKAYESRDPERTYFGLWERDRPTLMPLSRLSSLVAVGLR